MAGSARLLVEIAASTATFQADLGKAAAVAEANARKIEASLNNAFASVKSSLLGLAASLGAGLTVHGFAEMIKSAIDAQAELGILGERAGISGAQLSSLSQAARLSGTGMESIADQSAKLSKALLSFGDEGAKSTIVLRALGVTAKEVPGLLADPAEALFRLAKLLNELPEGGTKAAAQLLIFGKAGGSTAAFLNELAKQTELVTTRTNEQVAAAREFNDRLTLLAIRSDEARTALANGLLPTLGDILTAFTALTGGAGGAKDKIGELAADGSLKEWARDAALVVGTLAESLIFTARAALAVIGSFKVAAAEVELNLAASGAPKKKPTGELGFTRDEADKANAEFDAALKKRNDTLAAANKAYQDLWNKNGAFVTDALNKQFALSDAAAKAQRDLPQNADRLDRLNISTAESAGKAAAAAAAARAKAVQSALDKGNTGSASTVDEFTRSLDAVAKMAAVAKLELHGAFANEEITSAQRALAALQADDSWAKFTENQKTTIRFAYEGVIATQQETAEWKKKREETQKQIKVFEDIAAAQQKAKESFTQTLGNYAEANDTFVRQIELIGADDLARQKLVATIEYERLHKQALMADDVKGMEILDKQYARRLKLLELSDATVKRIQDEIDIARVFQDAFSGAFTELITGAKSFADAFKSMEKSIVAGISRIAANKIGDALFGGATAGGAAGFSGLLSKLFGPFGGAGASAPFDSGLTGGFLAGGADFARGGPTMVGERGPEIVNLPRGSRVTPNNQLGGNVINISVAVDGATTRATADQIATRTGAAVRRAMARNA